MSLPHDDGAPPVLPASGLGADGAVPGAEAEQAWISVIQKMDETYAELLAQQVELEAKNEALEEAHAFIAGVMASMTDVLIACDLAGRIEQVNVAAERLFGRPASVLQVQRLADLIAPESPASFSDVLTTVARRERIADRDFTFLTPEGPLPVSVNGAIRFDPRGRAVGITLMGRPVGELRKAYSDLAAAHERLKETQQQLVQAEKMASLGRLVAGVAHELNNPISFVYGNAHTMKRYAERLATYLDALHGAPSPAAVSGLRGELKIDRTLAELGPTLAGMLEGAERVRDIVADLRRFSSDRRQGDEAVDMAGLVRSALDWVAKAQQPDVAIFTDLPDGLDVTGHPGQLHQVMMNLVQNALDALEGAPVRRLEITGRREGERVVVRVRDSGPGIAPDILSRVFDPFFTTKPVGKGTGLGLSICYRIVQEHEGTLAAANAPEGGAVMTLSLPAAGSTP
ncbi:HupT protein [Azorhizobium caulinodans ORS 571]|uniref:histidine kinase n=2 Tax=Azorhizobium caulinodans TaxID=7 RepID=A8IMQ7_AZOC5|nr:ATP-binding protein [Azorhizobium caulinodans]AAS91022.1 HupT [Azorhizobium caulinodans ORS 571]BAF86592.1 HupT protein [Azorhizobium caulinodans ORS 571]